MNGGIKDKVLSPSAIPQLRRFIQFNFQLGRGTGNVLMPHRISRFRFPVSVKERQQTWYLWKL